jgi:probable HAF family extracellular repeat protein
MFRGIVLAMAGCGVVLPADVLEPPDAAAIEDAAIDPDAAPIERTIRVLANGSGAGRVTSPAGIDCGTTCEATLPEGATLVLTASAAAGSVFAGWTPPCSASPDCTLVLDGDVTVAATFDRGRYDLELATNGEGAGRVVIDPGSRACAVPATCTAAFDGGESIVLTPQPEGRSTFRGWASGPCAGTDPCRFAITGRTRVTATFDAPGGLRRYSTIEDLGALPGDSESWAWAINDAGVVTGFSGPVSSPRAFRHSPSTGMVELQALGGAASTGFDINTNGWIAGHAATSAEILHGALWSPHPETDPADIGPMAFESNANALNDGNWIVGRMVTVMGSRHAFRRSSQGAIEDLGTLGGPASTALDINADGWIVGSADMVSGMNHAFRIAPAPAIVMEDLGSLGGASQAEAINEGGTIVGFSEIASGAAHAFLLEAGTAALIDLGTLGGSNSYAYDIEDAGIVVGAAEDGRGILRAFVWDPRSREMIDLSELLPRDAVGWELRFATGINASGHVVGVGIHDGRSVAYKLGP